jgi:hypothetical protein
LSVAEIDAWEETVKGVMEPAWETEIDASEMERERARVRRSTLGRR